MNIKHCCFPPPPPFFFFSFFLFCIQFLKNKASKKDVVERLYLMFYGRTNHDLMSSTMWSLAPQPAGPSVSVAEDDGKDNLVGTTSVVVNLIWTDIL